LEHLTQTIGAKVEEAHSGLDDERVARLEREAQTLKRVGEDVFRVQVRARLFLGLDGKSGVEIFFVVMFLGCFLSLKVRKSDG
jgi:hypothetical protein